MEIIFLIAAFIVFSLIADAVEGKKKKQKTNLPGKTDYKQKTGEKKKPSPIFIPPIKSTPPKTETPVVYREPGMSTAVVQSVVKYSEALKNPKKQDEEMQTTLVETKEKTLKPLDLRPDAIFNAICYTQILQPPKAYQYMRARTRRDT